MNTTQLKQGSLSGLRRQTNECLDSAYNKGYEDGKADAIYNTDMIDELKQVEYIRGLEDAWKLARKIEMLTCGEVRDIFGEKALTQFGDEEPSVFAIINQFSYQESESMINAYEEKKKAEEVENYHLLVDTLRTVTEEYPKETIVSALSEFGIEVNNV